MSKNKKKKKNKKAATHLGKKKKSQHVVDLEVNSKGIFKSSFHELSPLSFLSILERKLFGGLEEKTFGPHLSFFFLPI